MGQGYLGFGVGIADATSFTGTLKYGLANYLDVLIAQRNLFEAELALMGAHRLHLVSIVQLYKALGGGWTPEGQPSVSPVSPALEKS